VAHGGDGSALAHAKLQLGTLSRLQRRIGEASAGSLSALRGEVLATVAATQALTQQASAMGTQTYTTAQVALQRASEGARVSVTSFMHDYYDRHEFDQYLEFTSREDEDEYRKREEERKKAIDAALAEHTPQGNLKALDLSIAQLKDAGAHGADKSAVYRSTLDSLESNRDTLSSKVAAAEKDGSLRPTAAEPADAPVRADVLAQLRAAKVTLADPTLEGHGVNSRGVPAADARERT
jgi:hypothetical protein